MNSPEHLSHSAPRENLSIAYDRAVAARRDFQLPGYPTLADLGFNGHYVCPIQLTSGSLEGPMLVSKDWLDAPSVRANDSELKQTGYLAGNPFNRVIDIVLRNLGLSRANIYITPIFHLLTPHRSSAISPAHARASFDAVGRLELMGRRPVALGTDSARVLRYFGIEHVEAPHPSARIGSYEARAERIASAMERAQ